MTTLEKRATPSQLRLLRAIAGAVNNAAHAHRMELPKHFARSVAKRATGTLTSQWDEVLAAKAKLRQNGSSESLESGEPRGSWVRGSISKGDRLGLLRRSPILSVWKKIQQSMWKIKHEGTPEQYAAHVRILRLLDQAQKEWEKL